MSQGMLDLRVWPNQEADGNFPSSIPGKARDHGKEQMQRLAKVCFQFQFIFLFIRSTFGDGTSDIEHVKVQVPMLRFFFNFSLLLVKLFQ
jgi:hypothetical protein